MCFFEPTTKARHCRSARACQEFATYFLAELRMTPAHSIGLYNFLLPVCQCTRASRIAHRRRRTPQGHLLWARGCNEKALRIR
mmetsp:Transcript_46406/g.73279  ORF Transcript_46406/g.73279 Transcript_46406/m.73279 type:complete len:83 (+) Transcript_46406:2292-2540(+)